MLKAFLALHPAQWSLKVKIMIFQYLLGRSGGRRAMEMNDLYVKSAPHANDTPEDLFAEGSSKRHRNQVQRLKSSELGASPRSPASTVPSPRTEPVDSDSTARWDQHQNKIGKAGPIHRGRGRPPKIPRLEDSPISVT